MRDGGTRLTDPRPCKGCGGVVDLISGRCDRCSSKHLRPQPGPQEQFLSSDADIVLYGGSAYGGKSFSLLLDALRYCNTPGWAGLILRRHAKDFTDPTSIFEKAKKVYAGTGARFRSGGDRDVRWPSSGATIAFRHLDGVNMEGYQGMEYAWIGIDEATHFELSWILYLIGRMRTDCGTKPRMRLTCNPDPDHAISEWVNPYLIHDEALTTYGCPDRKLSGVVRYLAPKAGRIVWGSTRDQCAKSAERPIEDVKSFAFVMSSLDDNPIGLALNPGYAANLALHGPVTEARLRYGNWKVRENVGGMLRYAWWGHLDEPLAPIVRRVRAWDLAATKPKRGGNYDPDYTIGILIWWDIHGRWYIADMVACREDSPEVDKLMAATARADYAQHPDTIQVTEIEGGSSGKRDALTTRKVLRSGCPCTVVTVPANKNKAEKARPMARELKLGMNGNNPRIIEMGQDEDGVWTPRGFILYTGWTELPYLDDGDHPPTLGALFWQQVTPFFDPKAPHDDIPDAMAIGHNAGSVQPSPPPERAVDRFRRLS